MKENKSAFLLRFENENQKKEFQDIAQANKRSLNSEIIHMISIKILESKSKGVSSKK